MKTTDSTKYLGRALSFTDPHRTELENRIASAWRKFYKLKKELTGSRYSLTDRLRLFHGTVTPTVLYASESWTLTTELENRLRRTQRQMLRMIVHAPRRRQVIEAQPTQPETTTQPNTTITAQSAITIDTSSDSDVDSAISDRQIPPLPDDTDNTELEPWADWIKRSTHDVEARMKRLKLDDWVSLQRRRKWKWAQKLALCEDSSWATAAIQWDPTLDPRLNSQRRPGRPKTRWADDIYKYIQHTTTTTTTDISDTGGNHTTITTTNDSSGNLTQQQHQPLQPQAQAQTQAQPQLQPQPQPQPQPQQLPQQQQQQLQPQPQSQPQAHTQPQQSQPQPQSQPSSQQQPTTLATEPHIHRQITSPQPLNNEVWLNYAKDIIFWDTHEENYAQRFQE